MHSKEPQNININSFASLSGSLYFPHQICLYVCATENLTTVSTFSNLAKFWKLIYKNATASHQLMKKVRSIFIIKTKKMLHAKSAWIFKINDKTWKKCLLYLRGNNFHPELMVELKGSGARLSGLEPSSTICVCGTVMFILSGSSASHHTREDNDATYVRTGKDLVNLHVILGMVPGTL